MTHHPPRLSLSALINTPRDEIEKNQELVLPTAARVFGAVHAWPKYTPMLAYDMLIKYHTPRRYNTSALSLVITVPHLICFSTQAHRIYNTVGAIDNLGFFETKSGRDEILRFTDTSLIPVALKRRNDHVSLDYTQSRLYRECIEAVAEIARTSFAYDEAGHCVTVSDADVRRVAGLLVVE